MDVWGQIVFSRLQRAKVLYLQAALSHVLNISVAIDGRWGPETENGTRLALQMLSLSGTLENAATWRTFLSRVAERAFQSVFLAASKSARELLQDVYSIINHELAGKPERKGIETALSAFINHEETQRWLEGFTPSEMIIPAEEEEQPEPAYPEDTDVALAAKSVVVRRAGSAKPKWYATVDGGAEFYVGGESKYKTYRGLSNYSAGARYSPDDYRGTYGFWANFIYPTVMCESNGYFHCLNTYDRAYFTFGFLQFAAHVYDGDFSRYFRALLDTPQGPQYFPDLTLKDNRIHRVTEAGLVKLETQDKPQPLAVYLNPTSTAVEEREVKQSARFIHWVDTSPEHQSIQVRIGVEIFKEGMASYASTYGLNGMIDKICVVIADIHHHGRGGEHTKKLIKEALDTGGDLNKAYNNLLKIGESGFKERVKTLRETISQMINQGQLGKMKYNKTKKEFVPQ